MTRFDASNTDHDKLADAVRLDRRTAAILGRLNELAQSAGFESVFDIDTRLGSVKDLVYVGSTMNELNAFLFRLLMLTEKYRAVAKELQRLLSR